MKFSINSRFEITNYYNDKDKYAIISIASPYDEYPKLIPGYVDVLRLKFLDIDFNEYYVFEKLNKSYRGFEREDAVEILDFTEKYKNKVDLFVVNCNAGISRSSGVVAALSKIYNGDDSWVFKTWLYRPNMRVYRHIIDEAAVRGLIG